MRRISAPGLSESWTCLDSLERYIWKQSNTNNGGNGGGGNDDDNEKT